MVDHSLIINAVRFILNSTVYDSFCQPDAIAPYATI